MNEQNDDFIDAFKRSLELLERQMGLAQQTTAKPQNRLASALKMLAKNSVPTVNLLCDPRELQEALGTLGQGFVYNRASCRLTMLDTTFRLFGLDSYNRLRGVNAHATVVKGNIAPEIEQILPMITRLGECPMVIKLV